MFIFLGPFNNIKLGEINKRLIFIINIRRLLSFINEQLKNVRIEVIKIVKFIPQFCLVKILNWVVEIHKVFIIIRL